MTPERRAELRALTEQHRETHEGGDWGTPIVVELLDALDAADAAAAVNPLTERLALCEDSNRRAAEENNRLETKYQGERRTRRRLELKLQTVRNMPRLDPRRCPLGTWVLDAAVVDSVVDVSDGEAVVALAPPSFCSTCGNLHPVKNHQKCADNVAAGLHADGQQP
jgi:hypothetical protein